MSDANGRLRVVSDDDVTQRTELAYARAVKISADRARSLATAALLLSILALAIGVIALLESWR